MMLIGTLLVLILWLSFMWLFDPDGFRKTEHERRPGHSIFGPAIDSGDSDERLVMREITPYHPPTLWHSGSEEDSHGRK